MVPPDSHGISGVPSYLGTHSGVHSLRLQEYHPLRCAFPGTSTSLHIYHSSPGQQPRPSGPTTPHMQRLPAITHIRFGLFRVRSPLLTESLLFSLPTGTEMFHFPALPPTPYEFRCWSHAITRARFPHSDILASTLGYQLHQAYRRFPRPSSAPNAKASTMRP